MARSFPANISQLALTYNFKKHTFLQFPSFPLSNGVITFASFCARTLKVNHTLLHISSIAASHMMISVQ